MPIEQAIFTSAATAHAMGYQLVAASRGIGEEDARALAVWGPSHDSLLSDDAAAGSVNFHPLPSGEYCISKTVAAGDEYSGRQGPRVYTQCLVVAPDALARFANNPFVLLRAAAAKGALRTYSEPPSRLAPFELPGRSQPVDERAVHFILGSLGPDKLAWLIDAALSGAQLAIVAANAEALFSGLLNCLPISLRVQLSFSTGLRCSAQRPFRAIRAPPEAAEQRQLHRRYGLRPIDLRDEPPREPMSNLARSIVASLEKRPPAQPLDHVTR